MACPDFSSLVLFSCEEFLLGCLKAEHIWKDLDLGLQISPLSFLQSVTVPFVIAENEEDFVLLDLL